MELVLERFDRNEGWGTVHVSRPGVQDRRSEPEMPKRVHHSQDGRRGKEIDLQRSESD
ncbi:hypothetical protein [Desulfatitalea tepidiphila]|uniref:hypothetical protein n=1 Tax=Desulfatitalea tepidiphila TaxID=1185843 RepID=UPI00137919AB|nr:hypothetical protein [Desulfatitalea tepidiphila]